MAESQAIQSPSARTPARTARVTAFICTNSARHGMETVARLGRPRAPVIPWTGAVEEINIPCSGRLQPEHLLKAFEAGADLVCVIGCAEDNCHFLEGSCRAGRRAEYVRGLLKDIGLGDERLMFFHLPGSAREDLTAGLRTADSQPASGLTSEELARQLAAIAKQVAQRLRALPANPLHTPPTQPPELDERGEFLVAEETEENED